MDTRTGEITLEERWKEVMSNTDREKYLKQIDPVNLSQVRRKELMKFGKTQVTERSRCPCGSGKRFKRCCMNRSLGNG